MIYQVYDKYCQQAMQVCLRRATNSPRTSSCLWEFMVALMAGTISPLWPFVPFLSEPHEIPAPSSGWNAPVCYLLCQPNNKLDKRSTLNDAHIYQVIRILNCRALWLYLKERVRVGSQILSRALLKTVNFKKRHSQNEIPKAVRTDAWISYAVCDIWQLAGLLQRHLQRNRTIRPRSGQPALAPRVLSSTDNI